MAHKNRDISMSDIVNGLNAELDDIRNKLEKRENYLDEDKLKSILEDLSDLLEKYQDFQKGLGFFRRMIEPNSQGDQ